MGERFYTRLPKTALRSSWLWVTDTLPLPSSNVLRRSWPAGRRRLVIYRRFRRGRGAVVEVSTVSDVSESMAPEEIGAMTQLAARQELGSRYAVLLERIDPSIRNTPEFAEEFAAKLVDFSASWGQNFPHHPEQIEASKRELFAWIDQHTQASRSQAIRR